MDTIPTDTSPREIKCYALIYRNLLMFSEIKAYYFIIFFLDKMCDQISDAILDAHLKQDPDAKVACETVTKTGMIMVCGEITSKVIN